MTDAPMRIIELRAENVKRLTAVSIRPDGNLVQITGRNGQGKTSVLDSIWFALTSARNIQRMPIRDGAERAVIRLDLGELKVTRTFNRQEDDSYTTALKVEGADGTRFSSPADVLAALAGELSYDPLAFTRDKPADQFDTLRGFVTGYDFDSAAAADKLDYDARTTANRRAKELRAQAEGITLPAGKIPKRVDTVALEAKLAEAAGTNDALSARRANRIAAEQRLQDTKDEIARLTAVRDDLQAKLDAAEPLPEPIDTAAVREQLVAGREANTIVDYADRRERLEADARGFEDESARLTAAMDKREEAKQAAIAAASMPVKGLGFGDGFVTLNGVPFDQASDAEQLRASIAIAAALNPRLRIVRVRDGSLLDDVAMKELAAFADEHDVQIWIERVDSSGTVGFVLEDGHLKTDEPEEAV